MPFNWYEALFRLLKGFSLKSGIFSLNDLLSLLQWTRDKRRLVFNSAGIPSQ